MTSIFKQAATQSRIYIAIQSEQSTAPPQSKVYNHAYEQRSGKNKLESKHSSRIMTNYAKDIASRINSFLDSHQLSVSSTYISMLKKSKES
jgi:hypothetical protein